MTRQSPEKSGNYASYGKILAIKGEPLKAGQKFQKGKHENDDPDYSIKSEDLMCLLTNSIRGHRRHAREDV